MPPSLSGRPRTTAHFGETGGLDILAEDQPGVLDQDVEIVGTAARGGHCRRPILTGHVEAHIEPGIAEDWRGSRDRAHRARLYYCTRRDTQSATGSALLMSG